MSGNRGAPSPAWRAARRLAARLASAGFALTFAIASGRASAAEPQPRLVGDPGRLECQDALTLADASFRSRTPALGVSTSKPPPLHSRLVLSWNDQDGGMTRTLVGASEMFDKRPIANDDADNVYWQRGPATATAARLVVVDFGAGWQGDVYDLYLLPAAMTFDDFIARMSGDTSSHPTLAAAVEHQWQAPVVLQSPSTRALWLIDTGHPANPLGAWKVMTPGASGFDTVCSIDFGLGLEDGKDPVTLLPPEIARLDELLTDARGPETSQGTLHPTTAIAIDVRHAWADIALRPWSVKPPYNSRAEVEAGLAQWASQARSRARELAAIQARYEPARRALAGYYRDRFHLAPAAADRFATYALDVAYRTYFVFHKEDRDADDTTPAPANPWPDAPAG